MSDLVERLRASSPALEFDWGLIDEAADEIGRLRAELAEAVTALPQAVRNEREQCAKLAEAYEPRCDTCPRGVSNAIRSRK